MLGVKVWIRVPVRVIVRVRLGNSVGICILQAHMSCTCWQTSRQIPCDCASSRLVYAAVQEGRAQYNQTLALAALNTSAAAAKLRKAVSDRHV